MELEKIVYANVDWIKLTQNKDMGQALVNTAMNLQVP
jgi:hypothetical protein